MTNQLLLRCPPPFETLPWFPVPRRMGTDTFVPLYTAAQQGPKDARRSFYGLSAVWTPVWRRVAWPLILRRRKELR